MVIAVEHFIIHMCTCNTHTQHHYVYQWHFVHRTSGDHAVDVQLVSSECVSPSRHKMIVKVDGSAAVWCVIGICALSLWHWDTQSAGCCPCPTRRDDDINKQLHSISLYIHYQLSVAMQCAERVSADREQLEDWTRIASQWIFWSHTSSPITCLCLFR